MDSEQEKILIETSTTVRIMNQRLFGGDGQMGALPYLNEQHRAIVQKLDTNKQELLDRIDDKKAETDEDIKTLTEEYNKLDRKVNWFAGGITALGTAASFLLGWHNKG